MSHTHIQLAQRVGCALFDRNWQITTAESCTGGGIAHAITAVAGSSKWFNTGYVTYANHAKSATLGVSSALICDHGAVSKEVASAMARGALIQAGADISVAVTGIAGPEGGTEQKPVGTVWFAWATASGVICRCEQFDGDREAVRDQTIATALQGVLTILGNE